MNDSDIDFVTALVRQFRDLLDETIYFTRADVVGILAVAAGAVLGDSDPVRVTLHREVSPENGVVWHTLTIGGSGQLALLDTEDIATLRAVLATYDETRAARVGDLLTMPMRLKDGRVVTEWPGDGM